MNSYQPDVINSAKVWPRKQRIKEELWNVNNAKALLSRDYMQN